MPDIRATSTTSSPEPVSDVVTRLTVHEQLPQEQRDRSKQGLEECLDKLVAIYA